MSTPRPQTFSLDDNLGRHISCAENLAKLLAEERDVLLSNDLEGLERICVSKSAAAQELQSLSASLNRGCGASNASAIENFIRHHGDALSLGRWNSLRELAAHCARANLENGALLQERQTRVRSLLQVIQQDTRPLYGRSGASPVPAMKRALASA